MTIVTNWYEWYEIDVHKWIFLELEKAKITIDSYHVSVSFLN